MRIKGAFKGCLRFCGRPAISLRRWRAGILDGAVYGWRGGENRDEVEAGNWINVRPFVCAGGSRKRSHGNSRLSHCNKLCLHAARIRDSTRNRISLRVNSARSRFLLPRLAKINLIIKSMRVSRPR